jgi:hypothetical protein
MGKRKCEFCGTKTTSSWDLCRACKSALHHGHKRVEAEGLIVDETVRGAGSWWVWSPKGEVLVLGRTSKRDAIIALMLDPVERWAC